MIEPLGLLYGEAATDAVRCGLACSLQGGPAAFTLVRLLDEPDQPLRAVATIDPDRLRCLRAAPSSAGLPGDPMVMGILNVTPDSFSDGGRHFRLSTAIAAGRAMIEAGAGIVDIGGESTRPGAEPVDPDEEQARILPVLAGLRGQGASISIDTRNGSTMRAALDGGADLINDVSALSHDPDAASLLAMRRCPVVLMHMRGTPATMAGLARYDDVAVEVVRELEQRIAGAVAAGIARSRIFVDPGIGFAKTGTHSLELLRRLPILANLGCRVVLGTSRKRFLGEAAGTRDPAQRDPGTIVSSLPGLCLPGCILRVHTVPQVVQALRVWQALCG